MHRIMFCAAALMALGAFAPAAQAEEYPWCAYYGGDMGGAKNCGFTTLAQCQADVSGIGGFCDRNPFYRPARRNRGQR